MTSEMTSEQKKAFLLLKSVIFHYHGLDDDEQAMLVETAVSLDAGQELDWVRAFIATDAYSAFDRARAYLNGLALDWDVATRLAYLSGVWEATNRKGYISEMEATAMLKLAKDWHIQTELMNLIRKR